MLRKATMPSSNNSKDIIMIIQGAKKRRRLASAAIYSANTGLGFAPNIKLVK